jgi:hypothetical protein
MIAMILAFEAPEDFEKRRNKAAFEGYMAEWRAYADALRHAGIFRSGAALEGPETATVVSVSNGRRSVEDGPFPDSKEQLGGFFMVEVASLDEAARWASKCPAAKNGRVDARAVPDYGQGE